jgi:hypothetical protein
MKRRIPHTLIGLIVLLALLGWGVRDAWFSDDVSRAKVTVSAVESGPVETARRSRSKERAVGKSHRPEQLVRFYLPDLEIDGMGLRGALAKLNSAYVDACVKSGEKPLVFSFDVRGEDRTRLTMTLSGKTFSSSVRILASSAGMNVRRNNLTYIFEPMGKDGANERTIVSQPDLKLRLGKMAGMTDEELMDPDWNDLLARLGISVDPKLKVVARPDGSLTIHSPDGSDVGKLVALFGQLGSEQEARVKATSKLVRVSPHSDWKFDGTESMADLDVQLMLRALAQRRGVDLMSMPSVMAKHGQEAKMEIVREVSIESAEGQAEQIMVGKVMDLNAKAVGFGQSINATFIDTDVDESGAGVRELANLGTDGFSDDGATRISVQEMPDGSKVILMVTGELIDPTGLPIRPDTR